MEKLFDLIRKLVSERFYGSLEIKFESGNVVLVKKVQTIKMD